MIRKMEESVFRPGRSSPGCNLLRADASFLSQHLDPCPEQILSIIDAGLCQLLEGLGPYAGYCLKAIHFCFGLYPGLGIIFWLLLVRAFGFLGLPLQEVAVRAA